MVKVVHKEEKKSKFCGCSGFDGDDSSFCGCSGFDGNTSTPVTTPVPTPFVPVPFVPTPTISTPSISSSIPTATISGITQPATNSLPTSNTH